HEKRLVGHERQQLLRAARRAQRPEARSDASSEYHDPDVGLAHKASAPDSSPLIPTSSAARAYSFFGLNGLVRNSLAPSSMARWCCCSCPAAVRMIDGRPRKRASAFIAASTSRP